MQYFFEGHRRMEQKDQLIVMPLLNSIQQSYGYE